MLKLKPNMSSFQLHTWILKSNGIIVLGSHSHHVQGQVN